MAWRARFHDGQVGTVTLPPHAAVGLFVSDTGARFTVRRDEVAPEAGPPPVAPPPVPFGVARVVVMVDTRAARRGDGPGRQRTPAQLPQAQAGGARAVGGGPRVTRAPEAADVSTLTAALRRLTGVDVHAFWLVDGCGVVVVVLLPEVEGEHQRARAFVELDRLGYTLIAGAVDNGVECLQVERADHAGVVVVIMVPQRAAAGAPVFVDAPAAMDALAAFGAGWRPALTVFRSVIGRAR